MINYNLVVVGSKDSRVKVADVVECYRMKKEVIILRSYENDYHAFFFLSTITNVCKTILVTKKNTIHEKHTIICISTRRGTIWRAQVQLIASAQLKTANRQRAR